MIRLLVFLLLMAAAAAGFAWIADRPGDVALTFMGNRYETSLAVGALAIFLVALGFTLIWTVLSFVFRLPSLMSIAARARRRNKGYAALTRGMVAAGSGDTKLALKSAETAQKYLGEDPLTLLLRAQAAQLVGDRAQAERLFARMVEMPETRVLGLRGLHLEAQRRGDEAGAHHYAEQAQRIASLPWAGQAVLDHYTATHDWARALATVEANLAQRIIDKDIARRQRAVLQTAIARELVDSEADEALRLAREAADLAPDLVPATALAGRLLARRGDLRKATRLLEKGWKLAPHPDLARIYLDVRSGDSASERLNRAKTLADLAPHDLESQLVLARAAMDAREFATARQALAPLISASQRPFARVCLLMAELEELESGAQGRVREWLARATHAPRDRAWVADGVVSDQWAPVSPVTGKLDAFRWQQPAEQLSADLAPLPPLTELLENAAPEPEKAVEPTPAPAPAKEAPEKSEALEDALTKLASIRRAAQVETPRRSDIFPLPSAPDDPGPDAPTR
jgi:HemY protein